MKKGEKTEEEAWSKVARREEKKKKVPLENVDYITRNL